MSNTPNGFPIEPLELAPLSEEGITKLREMVGHEAVDGALAFREAHRPDSPLPYGSALFVWHPGEEVDLPYDTVSVLADITTEVGWATSLRFPREGETDDVLVETHPFFAHHRLGPVRPETMQSPMDADLRPFKIYSYIALAKAS